MKNYQLLLAGLLLLLLVISIGAFAWLWISNSKNINPLPITYSDATEAATDPVDDANTIAISALHLQAADSIQDPLDDIISRFESRYPKIKILARYVPTNSLLTLPDTTISNDQPSPLIVNTDIIIADDKLNKNQLADLQALLNKVQAKADQTLIKGVTSGNGANIIRDTEQVSSTDSITKIPVNKAKSLDDEMRSLISFSYALKAGQSVDGVILTDNSTAITFRNFLLSSTGQDILKKYDYDNIDGYKSSLNELFNPSSRSKTADGDDVIEVADVLSNSE